MLEIKNKLIDTNNVKDRDVYLKLVDLLVDSQDWPVSGRGSNFVDDSEIYNNCKYMYILDCMIEDFNQSIE